MNKATMKCSVFLGKSIILEKVSGKVIAKNQWSETHVHGGGGGGYGGHNAPVHISSTAVNKGALWLTDQDNNEFTWNLTGTNLGAREGHVLSAAAPKNGKSHVAAYNHNLDRFEWWGCNKLDFRIVINTVCFLPICLLWLGIFVSPESIEWFAEYFYETRRTIEISLAIFLSIGWFFGSYAACLILGALIAFIRKKLFSIKYKSLIEKFLKESEEL